MAACTTTYLDTGKCWSARNIERNAELLAMQAERRRCMRTPEFPFPKSFDNSRLIKTSDPARPRQIRLFLVTITMLFSLSMLYGWQHYSARMNGYQIEAEKLQREQLREVNRELRLDTSNGKILNDASAMKQWSREYEKGWEPHL